MSRTGSSRQTRKRKRFNSHKQCASGFLGEHEPRSADKAGKVPGRRSPKQAVRGPRRPHGVLRGAPAAAFLQKDPMFNAAFFSGRFK